MSDCECLAKCPFFNKRMANLPAVAEMLIQRLCKGDNSTCARYMIFKAKGPEHVPGDLLPNQTDRAKQIISAS